MTTRIPRTFSLLTTLLMLTLGWFAVPYASQKGANDGFILFSTNRDHPSDDVLCPGCEDIYVMSPDGSSPTRITSNAFNHKAPAWSHSKKTIAFHSNGGMVGGPEIFLMNLDGTDRRVVASLGAVGAQFPSFSPNGNELCFNSQTVPRDIYIVNVHGGGLTNLTNSPADDFRCAWSPKGDDILVSSRERKANSESYANSDIHVVTADGSAPVRLTTNAASDANPAWSPDGERIAFESNRHGNAEIYVMNADGTGEPVRLTFFAGLDTKPSWSPTGDRIAFHRQIVRTGETRGHLEVYTMNANGSDVTRITVTPRGFSGFPSWGKWSARP